MLEMFNTLQGGGKKKNSPQTKQSEMPHTHTQHNKLLFDLREQRELNSLVHMENMTEIQGQKEPPRQTELLLDHCTRIHKAVIILTSQNIVHVSGSVFIKPLHGCELVSKAKTGISNLSNSD